MTLRRKLGDRRMRPRYDILGDLWGTVEIVLPMPLKDLGRGGVLIESHVPLLQDSVHRLTFDVEGETVATQVRVRRTHVHAGEDGETRYLIGVEFMGVNPTLLRYIERLLAAHAGEPAGAEA